MAYQVLARKYRPQRFSDVAGQDHVTRTLAHALQQERVAHGYIFSGHRGIGKTTIARILAMALNCRNKIGSLERPSPEPCGVCDSCKEIRAGNSLDVVEIDAPPTAVSTRFVSCATPLATPRRAIATKSICSTRPIRSPMRLSTRC